MIKYNEAQSIRKTYEQIVKRLNEERIGFDNQLQAIERTLKAKQHDSLELQQMCHDANHAREIAKAELAQCRHQYEEMKKQREKELAERKQYVQARVEMTHRLEKRESIRRINSLPQVNPSSFDDQSSSPHNHILSSSYNNNNPATYSSSSSSAAAAAAAAANNNNNFGYSGAEPRPNGTYGPGNQYYSGQQIQQQFNQSAQNQDFYYPDRADRNSGYPQSSRST